MDGTDPPEDGVRTGGVRVAASWIAGWLAASAVIGALLIAWTLARGGHLHRTLGCGRGPDASVYALSLGAGALGLVLVMLYWALGTRSVLRRWVRLLAVAVVAMPILAVGFLLPAAMTPGCG